MPIRQIDQVPAGPAAGLLIDSNLTDPAWTYSGPRLIDL